MKEALKYFKCGVVSAFFIKDEAVITSASVNLPLKTSSFDIAVQ